MNNPLPMYPSTKTLAAMFDMSELTVRRRIEELKNENVLYGRNAVLTDGCVRVYLPAFIHYINNRRFLSHKSMRKHVPEYKPDALIKELALSEWENQIKPQEPDKEQIKQLLIEILKEGLEK